MQSTGPLSEGDPQGILTLEDGTEFKGRSFGFPASCAGEIVFNTGMVGYPDALTDPSYRGQILTVTYPLIGNYGIPQSAQRDNLNLHFESNQIQATAMIVADYSSAHSHWNARQSLGDWLKAQQIPALTGIDTRTLTKKLRDHGSMLARIEIDRPVEFHDPNLENLVAKSSIEAPQSYGNGSKTVVLVDCGAKHNIVHKLLAKDLTVMRVPWDYDFTDMKWDGILISNGPGDPQTCGKTVEIIRKAFLKDRPIFGICMGHQLLSLAAGASTYKLKFGHRSQNQPVREVGSNRCLVTSQNHGFAVDNDSLSGDWQPWFINLNDGTNEGIRHAGKPFMSVQFHPEAAPGPVDAEYLFEEFRTLIG